MATETRAPEWLPPLAAYDRLFTMPDMIANQKVMVELHDAASVGTYVQVKKSSKPYEMTVPI